MILIIKLICYDVFYFIFKMQGPSSFNSVPAVDPFIIQRCHIFAG